MGLISPVSGRETDKIVAFGNSSKIHTASPHCLAEWDLGITPSDWTTPLAISLSVDISTTFFHANTNSSPFACDFGRDTIIKKKTHTQKRESLSCEEQERSFEGQRSGFYSFSKVQRFWPETWLRWLWSHTVTRVFHVAYIGWRQMSKVMVFIG